MDLTVTRVGTMYRFGDMLVKVGEKYSILSIAPKGKVDIIEALSHCQRRSLPVSYDVMLSALNEVSGRSMKKIEHYRLLMENGERILFA